MLKTHQMFPNLVRLELVGVPMRKELSLRHLTKLRELKLGVGCGGRVLPKQDAELTVTHNVGRSLEHLCLANSGLRLGVQPGHYNHLCHLNLEQYEHWPKGGVNWLVALGPTLRTLMLRNIRGLWTLDGLEAFQELCDLDVRDSACNVVTSVHLAILKIFECRRLSRNKLVRIHMSTNPLIMGVGHAMITRDVMIEFLNSFLEEPTSLHLWSTVDLHRGCIVRCVAVSHW